MKKVILLFAIILMLFSFKKIDSNIYNGKINQNQLSFIKNNYPWKTGEILVINYRQPRNSCHYDNYKNLSPKTSSKYWNDFYSKMEFKNISNIWVYADSKRANKVLDNTRNFEDKYYFFSVNFFSKDKTCHGILAINDQGDYIQKNGEYTQEEVAGYLKKLE